jgi:dTMP kinase
MKRGKLYVLEGPDGVGKTTLAALLCETLQAASIASTVLSFPGREPNTVSELVYRLYHSPSEFGVTQVLPVTSQILVTAAHVDVIETRILPALNTGTTVILDRFWWSTWVYARASKVPEKTIDGLLDLEMLSWGTVKPDAIFLIANPEPFAWKTDPETWAGLFDLYTELAQEEERANPVYKMLNNTDPRETVSRILAVIQDT